MADNSVVFTININGNAYKGVMQIDEAFKKLTITANSPLKIFEKLGGAALKFNQVTDAIRNANEALSGIIKPGVDFDYSLRELSAIAQVAGKELDEIGNKARNLAKTFGGDAAGYVESFKDVIGSLGETFTDSTALDMMGKNVATLSKLMGGDAKAAANALTTAMLQYGVDLKNPIEASKEATRMMNVMQAAANVGGSEVSDTAEALRQSGLLAKQSGLSFEELNASLEALAKGKVVAGEAGTAMRNMLLSMNTLQGAPKKTAESLRKYGVNVALVTDPTAKFTDRLREMQKIQGNAVLMEEVFMKANIASASTMLNNIDAIDEYTTAITGTNAAVEGAAVIMESYAERQERIQAQFENMKISIFNATGDMGIWIQTLSGAILPIAQLMPLFSSIGMGLKMLGSSMTMAGAATTVCSGHINRFTVSMRAAQIANKGFGMNMLNMVAASLKFVVSPITGAVKAIRTLVAAKRAGTIASITFAGVSKITWTAIAVSAKTACKSIGVAIMNIPVIGWIVAVIAAIIALIRYFSNLGKKTDDTADKMNELRQSFAQYYAQERSQLDSIFAKLKQTNPKSEERKRLVQELAELYPELNKQTLDDITNTNNLSAAYDILLGKIVQRARLKTKEKELEQLFSNETYADFENLISEMVTEDIENNPTIEAWDLEKKERVTVNRTFGQVFQQTREQVLKNGVIYHPTRGRVLFSKELTDAIEAIDKEAGVVSNFVAKLTEETIGNGAGGTTPPETPLGDKEADSISGGGKQIKNFYITIDSLIGSNTNHFSSSRDNPTSAGGFTDMLTDALQSVVNDVNYAVSG